MAVLDPCLEQNVGRRRRFWTTQPDVCGEYDLCGVPCAIPGLEYQEVAEVADGRTIKTDDWLRSLILNILNTRARTDLRCPAPTAVFGHWSESYRNDGLYIGSRLWNAAAKPYVRIADAVKANRAAIVADLAKLVALNVADSVDVEVTYRGRNRADVTITAIRLKTSTVLRLSGEYSTDTWIWQ